MYVCMYVYIYTHTLSIYLSIYIYIYIYTHMCVDVYASLVLRSPALPAPSAPASCAAAFGASEKYGALRIDSRNNMFSCLCTLSIYV